MSSTRTTYDACAYQKKLQESTGSLSYMLYGGKYYNSRPCRNQLGLVGGNNVSLSSSNLVDLESDLRGQTRPASRCPQMKYTPQCSDRFSDGYNGYPCNYSMNSGDLMHLPACSMMAFPPTVMPPQITVDTCQYPPSMRKPQPSCR